MEIGENKKITAECGLIEVAAKGKVEAEAEEKITY